MKRLLLLILELFKSILVYLSSCSIVNGVYMACLRGLLLYSAEFRSAVGSRAYNQYLGWVFVLVGFAGVYVGYRLNKKISGIVGLLLVMFVGGVAWSVSELGTATLNAVLQGRMW